MKRIRVHFMNRIAGGPYKGQIERIGGINDNGEKWTISIQEAIKGLKTELWEFYTIHHNKEIPITLSILEQVLYNGDCNEDLDFLVELVED
ncbi:hypothetical protein GCM10028791_08070 [Echinicola sediminis]